MKDYRDRTPIHPHRLRIVHLEHFDEEPLEAPRWFLRVCEIANSRVVVYGVCIAVVVWLWVSK